MIHCHNCHAVISSGHQHKHRGHLYHHDCVPVDPTATLGVENIEKMTTPSPIDKNLAEFTANPKLHALRFPIRTVAFIEGEKGSAMMQPPKEISVFLVRTPQLIDLLTEVINQFMEASRDN